MEEIFGGKIKWYAWKLSVTANRKTSGLTVMLTRDIFCKLSCNVLGMSGGKRNELSTKKGVTNLTYQEV
jgi:hypothetical protein